MWSIVKNIFGSVPASIFSFLHFRNKDPRQHFLRLCHFRNKDDEDDKDLWPHLIRVIGWRRSVRGDWVGSEDWRGSNSEVGCLIWDTECVRIVKQFFLLQTENISTRLTSTEKQVHNHYKPNQLIAPLKGEIIPTNTGEITHLHAGEENWTPDILVRCRSLGQLSQLFWFRNGRSYAAWTLHWSTHTGVKHLADMDTLWMHCPTLKSNMSYSFLKFFQVDTPGPC